MVKSLHAMQETQVRSLGQEDPQEKEIATHCSVLTWKIPWMEEPGGLQSIGSQRVGHDGSSVTQHYIYIYIYIYIYTHTHIYAYIYAHIYNIYSLI